MQDKKQNTMTDRQLRELILAKADKAPQNPWFVRKVMNRLPHKPIGRKKSVPEILCYLLGILALICSWVYSVYSTINEGLTVTTIALSAILTFLTLFCIGVFALPAVKKAL